MGCQGFWGRGENGRGGRVRTAYTHPVTLNSSGDSCGYTYAPHVLTTAQQNYNPRNKSSVYMSFGATFPTKSIAIDDLFGLQASHSNQIGVVMISGMDIKYLSLIL